MKAAAPPRKGLPDGSYYYVTLLGLKAEDPKRLLEGGKLRPEESGRPLRASRVFGRALELFEGDDGAGAALALLAPTGARRLHGG